MHRFFVEPEQVGREEITIIGNDVNHMKNVLRMKPGEIIGISDGTGIEYTCEVLALNKEVKTKILTSLDARRELPSRITLFQGLPKSDKMEWIIQKAVELGVYEIIPMTTRNTVVKLDKKKEENKRKRWQAIAESAAKQSKRLYIPQVGALMSFSQAVKRACDMEVRLIPYELAENMAETREIIAGIRPGQRVAVFIGPEGGFGEEEIAMAMEAGIRPITLGKRILRTETAGISVLSVLMFTLEGEQAAAEKSRE